jgi:hypothetical protein
MEGAARHYQGGEAKEMPTRAKAIVRCRQCEIFTAWGHARFGFSVKIFLTEKEK